MSSHTTPLPSDEKLRSTSDVEPSFSVQERDLPCSIFISCIRHKDENSIKFTYKAKRSEDVFFPFREGRKEQEEKRSTLQNCESGEFCGVYLPGELPYKSDGDARRKV